MNHKRFADTYFSTFKGVYFTGDGAKRDAERNEAGLPVNKTCYWQCC